MLTPVGDTGLLVGKGADVDVFHHVISACKTTHTWRCGASADRYGPDYLWHLDADREWLSINWVDGPDRLFNWSVGVWPVAFDLLDGWLAGGPAIIHCDQGQSRSPTLAMAYLGKRTDVLGVRPTFVAAAVAFHRMFPDWAPNCSGIAGWVRDHWDTLGR